MTALSSLSSSVNGFISSDYGLGIDSVYTKKDGTELSQRVVRQEKDSKYSNRKIEGNTISDHEIFLITLSFRPGKNEKLIVETQQYYVDFFEKVGSDSYRLYVVANSQTVPSPEKRIEI